METLSWDDLRILLAVHRAGSLLSAGKALDMSTSTVSRRMDALEAAMGCQLAYRGQSGTELTPEALRMVQLAERLTHDLDALRRDKTALAGTLRISVPDGMAQVVALALVAFRDAHPLIDIEVVGESRMADVAAREADIAIRLTRSTSHVLVEKPLASFRFALFASADYVRRHLPSRRLSPSGAAAHPFVGLDERWKGLPHEQWMRSLGAKRFTFRSSSMEAIGEMVRRGAGLAAFLEHDPRNAGLIRIDTATPGPVQPFYLVYHRDLRKQRHVRAAVDAIVAYIARQGSPP